MWVTMWDRLSTRDKLRSWGLDVPATCLLCGTGYESRDHLFFQCSFASGVWHSFFTHRNLSPPVTLENIVAWVQVSSFTQKVKIICTLILQAVIYVIWKERNSRLHSPVVKSQLTLVKEIQILMRAKLFGMDRLHLSNANASSAAIDDESFKFFQR